MNTPKVVKAVVLMQQGRFEEATKLFKSFDKEEKRLFNELHKTKLSGSLYNEHGREMKENRQMVRHATNGPSKIRGTA